MSKIKGADCKERHSFTLSRNSVEFIHLLMQEYNYSSLSASLDKLIETVRRARDLENLNAGVSAYYDSLTPAEVREQSDWAELGEDGLSAFESESVQDLPATAVAAR